MQLERWMADWIRNYGDWSFVPQELEKSSRGEKEIALIIAAAIETALKANP